MPFKDSYLPRDLVLPCGDATYTVRPPSKETGAKLAAINVAGVATWMNMQDACPACGRAGTVTELPEETRELLEEMAHEDVSSLSLGADVVAQMEADGVPGAHIDTMAVYALYYWTLGEATADAIMEAMHGEPGKAETRSSASST